MNYIFILFVLAKWWAEPINNRVDYKYHCELTSDTTYYSGGQIHEIKYYVTDTGCLNTFRPEIPVIVIDEDCWDCGDIVQHLEMDTTNNYLDVTYSLSKERHPFSYLWYSNGLPKRDYMFYNKEKKFKMKELEYDSLQSIIKERVYYYVKDSVFDEKEGVTFTGWFREKGK